MVERDVAAAILDIYERAFAILCEADVVLSKVTPTPWLDEVSDAHDDIAMFVMSGMRDHIFERFPELDTDRPDGPPDSLLSAEDEAVVSGLTAEQVERIDATLLSDCESRGRKVARIIATALGLMRDELPQVPTGFYSRRVQALVAAGKLDSRGNLDHMRFSEVRLARNPLDEVVDAPIAVAAGTLVALKAFRNGPKRTDVVDADLDDPSRDLSPNLERLADRLGHGLADNPSKHWVLAQFQQSLIPVVRIDEEGRERFGDELKNVMGILKIDSDDGLLDFYLDWF